MSPSILVIRRKRQGLAFREERFRGRQFRCSYCNGVFFDENKIHRHLARHKSGASDNAELPKLDLSIDVRLPYLQDLKEIFGRRKARKSDG